MTPFLMVVRLLASLFATIVGRLRHGPLRPTWSFGFEVMARTLRRTGLAIGKLPPLEQRRAWEAIARTQPNRLAKEVRVESVDAGGVPARWIVPHGVDEDAPVLVYLHGGGYRYGSFASHGELVCRIARDAGVRALFVEYRLCPEHRFPAAVEDAIAATRWLLRSIEPSRVVVGGDSAGGALTLAVLLSLRDAGETLPAGGLCICPWVDPTQRGGSMLTNAAYDWAAPEHFDDWLRTYVEEDQVHDPRLSPMHADLRGLPPLLLQTGSAEMLYDQVVAFAEKAQAEGVDARLSVGRDMIHDWHNLASMFPEPARAVAECAELVRERADAERLAHAG